MDQVPQIRYLNAVITQDPAYNELTQPRQAIEAAKYISKSGSIVDKCSDYYCAVFRLAFDLDIPVFIPELKLPTADTTIYSITVMSKISNVMHYGRAFLKVPIETQDLIPQAAQPTDFYGVYWTYGQVLEALNEAITKAYAALVAAGSSVDPAQVPFFSERDGGFDLTAYPMSLYRYPATGNDIVQIFFNSAAYPLVEGWNYYDDTKIGQPPNTNGADFRLLFYNHGTNWLPQPLGAFSTGREPVNDAVCSIRMTQAFTVALPSISAVRLLSSLPSVGEFVQGGEGRLTQKILSDFTPDLSQTGGASRQIYNASFGDARWIKLTSEAPLTDLTLRLVAVDYRGQTYDLLLYSKSEDCNIKLCFAPNDLIEKKK